jgi:hypothetical protein
MQHARRAQPPGSCVRAATDRPRPWTRDLRPPPQVTASRLAADEEEDAPRAAGAGTGVEAAAHARGRLVSAMMKRHLVESVVPVMVELRRLLAEARSPLMGDLMACFSALLREYKGEVEEILVADKQVGAGARGEACMGSCRGGRHLALPSHARLLLLCGYQQQGRRAATG